MTDSNPLIDTVRSFVEAGFAIHWLKPRSKAPAGGDGWSDAPIATLDTLKASWVADNNVGVRLGEYSQVAGGYLYVIDLDVRVDEKSKEASARLFDLLPMLNKSFPVVISGSGGASRHIYFVSDKIFAGRKLAQSVDFKMVFDKIKGRDVKKRDWEIELFGTGKQVAMPPSIHPDTGNPYLWHQSFDFDMLAIGVAPFIPSAVIEALVGPAVADDPDPADAKPTLGMTLDEARAILDDLPVADWCEDRDGWFRAGMALHHEFGGSDDAFKLWDEFSRKSTKYDAKNQGQVWKSFKGKANPVRMATLLQAAKYERMMRGFDDAGAFDDEPTAEGGVDDGDEFDKLLGGSDDEIKSVSWTKLLDLNEEGAIKSTLHNLELIVENDIRTGPLARFNLFTQEIVQRGQPGVKPQRAKAAKPTRQLVGATWVIRDPINGGLWTDDKDGAVRSIIEAPKTQGGYSIKVSDRDLRNAIDNTARKNAFHPIREYFGVLAWDGTERLESLFVRYLGAPDTSYTRSVARLTLVAAVTRAHEPGHKFDYALILEGMQGKRKSTFIEILAKGWFAELDGDFHDTKQMVELMQGAWIMEIPELTGFSRSDVRAIKAFISRRSDKVRLAYAKRAQQFDRQGILIGSTNDDEYLRDDTGGRRFWPMACNLPGDKEIDTDGLLREIDQVWAEAFVIYRQMRAAQPKGTLPLTLTDKSAMVIAARLQEERRVETAADSLAGQIEAWLDEPVSTSGFDSATDPQLRTITCLSEIWVDCLGNDKRGYTAPVAQQLGVAMKKIKCWKASGKHTFEKYGRQRAIRRLGFMQNHAEDMIG